MHQLIASPFLGGHVVVRPGSPDGFKISRQRYDEVRAASTIPGWLADAAGTARGLRIRGVQAAGVLLVRDPVAYAFGRASYELNLGCNYDCEHCYLGLKKFEGLGWERREKLLGAITDSGVLWLQLTAGSP